MKKQILNLGKALNKAELKTINGGEPPCFEWCACPDLQRMFPNQYCRCNNNNGGNSGGGGGNNEGPSQPY